jgi:hypothetical protein
VDLKLAKTQHDETAFEMGISHAWIKVLLKTKYSEGFRIYVPRCIKGTE